MVIWYYNSIGVKCFDGFFELKTNGGPRVWADDKVYVNTEGKYLLLFNGGGGHKAAAQAARCGSQVYRVDIDRSWDSTKTVEVKQKIADGAGDAGVKTPVDLDGGGGNDFSGAPSDHDAHVDLPHSVTAGNVDHLHD